MMEKQEWYLKRNCSLSPRQAGIAYGVQCLLSLAVALLCMLHGVWQVFVFSALELLALAIAFLLYARHALDQERIALTEGCLLIERIEAGKVEQIRLEPQWTRIMPPDRYQDLIGLVSHGKKIEIGRFISGIKRKQIANELQRRLQYAD